VLAKQETQRHVSVGCGLAVEELVRQTLELRLAWPSIHGFPYAMLYSSMITSLRAWHLRKAGWRCSALAKTADTGAAFESHEGRITGSAQCSLAVCDMISCKRCLVLDGGTRRSRGVVRARVLVTVNKAHLG
jgi:hypothetical protein